MKIAYVVYPDFTALDLVGPYEIISARRALSTRRRMKRPGAEPTHPG